MKAQDYKDIKTSNAGTVKVMVDNEIWWEKKSLGPGPTKLIGGNEEAGFYGECPASELITGDELAKMIGLTEGTAQNLEEPWLKFAYMGKVEFVAKKTFRRTVTMSSIIKSNAVTGQRTINIGDKTYKIRLMKGKTEGKQNDIGSYQGDICKNSEWNKLMLPIHKNAPSSWIYPNNVNSPTENWNVGYTDDDLTSDYGYYSLCQEYAIHNISCLCRGGENISNSSYTYISGTKYNIQYGWRPVLELVD